MFFVQKGFTNRVKLIYASYALYIIGAPWTAPYRHKELLMDESTVWWNFDEVEAFMKAGF